MLTNSSRITRSLLAATAAVALMATPLAAQTAKSSKKVSSSAQSFVTKAANGGMLEVESSQLAATRAKDEAVRSFAQQMVSDHTKANDELKTVAGRIGATVPAKMDRAHQAQADNVRKATDARFDEAYVSEQVNAHRQAVSLFRSYSKSGRNADLKSFASRTLPVLEQHQTMVNELQNASSATGRASGASSRTGASGNSSPGSTTSRSPANLPGSNTAPASPVTPQQRQ